MRASTASLSLSLSVGARGGFLGTSLDLLWGAPWWGDEEWKETTLSPSDLFGRVADANTYMLLQKTATHVQRVMDGKYLSLAPYDHGDYELLSVGEASPSALMTMSKAIGYPELFLNFPCWNTTTSHACQYPHSDGTNVTTVEHPTQKPQTFTRIDGREDRCAQVCQSYHAWCPEGRTNCPTFEGWRHLNQVTFECPCGN